MRLGKRSLGSFTLDLEPSLELGHDLLVGCGGGFDGGELTLQPGQVRCLLGEACLASGEGGRGALGLSHRADPCLLERRQEAAQLGDDYLTLCEKLRALARLLAEPGELLAQSRHLGADREQMPIGLRQLRHRRRGIVLWRSQRHASLVARLERKLRAFDVLDRLRLYGRATCRAV